MAVPIALRRTTQLLKRQRTHAMQASKDGTAAAERAGAAIFGQLLDALRGYDESRSDRR